MRSRPHASSQNLCMHSDRPSRPSAPWAGLPNAAGDQTYHLFDHRTRACFPSAHAFRNSRARLGEWVICVIFSATASKASCRSILTTTNVFVLLPSSHHFFTDCVLCCSAQSNFGRGSCFPCRFALHSCQVCMIYFPDITGRGGWADSLLKILVRSAR
jgi:hypothetical protein